ncbi:MAG: hypothetical protein AB7D27_14865 [Desulfomicrobium sp.]
MNIRQTHAKPPLDREGTTDMNVPVPASRSHAAETAVTRTARTPQGRR